MVNLVLLSTAQDASYEETLRTGLELQGYTVWRKPATLDDSHTPRTIESALLGSACVLLLWSTYTERSREIAPQIPLLLNLKKRVITLLLDQTALPMALRSFRSYKVQVPWNMNAAQIVQQGLLPPAGLDDPLLHMAELAGSYLLTERKEAIKQAAILLQQNTYRDEVRAMLTYLAHTDLMTGIRDAAQQELNADTARLQASSPPATLATAGKATIRVSCKKCQQISTFNKQQLCQESRVVVRGKPDPEQIHVTCKFCGVGMMISLDCGGMS